MTKEFEDKIQKSLEETIVNSKNYPNLSSSRISQSKNNSAWTEIFEQYNVLEQIQDTGKYEICASTINKFREARLMAKFDHSSNLPDIFKKNDITILPNARGKYILSKAKTYHEFEDIKSTEIKMSLPEDLETLDYSSLTSESNVLSAAYISGILTDFLEEDKKFFYPTVNGRMKSGNFNFNVKTLDGKNLDIYVSNAQIEIDGGYEGQEIALIEAKNVLSKDFIVRQIYYPYRTLQSITNKPVRPVYLVYTDGTYQLYEYAFPDLYQYDNLELVKHKKYTLDPTSVSKNDIDRLIGETPIDYSADESRIIFPQADDFLKIINLCEHLLNDPMSSDEISIHFDFDKRQSGYYGNAARYLGLTQRANNSRLELTQDGKDIFSLDNRRDRHLKIIERILSKPVFRDCYLSMPASRTELKRITEESIRKHRPDISGGTIGRRASTVIKWCQWIQGLYT